MARVRAAALGAALLDAALGQCPTFGRRNYYAEHCEIITYDAASGFAYAWLNAGPCVDGFAAATDADVVAVWTNGNRGGVVPPSALHRRCFTARGLRELNRTNSA